MNHTSNVCLQGFLDSYSNLAYTCTFVGDNACSPPTPSGSNCECQHGLVSRDTQTRCVNGEWQGTQEVGNDFCNITGWIVRSLEAFHFTSRKATRISKQVTYTQRESVLQVICTGGTKGEPRLGAFCWKITASTIGNCVNSSSLPYPRFVLSEGVQKLQLSLGGSEYFIYPDRIMPHITIKFGKDESAPLEFEPSAYFAVGNSFSWYTFVWIDETYNGSADLISLSSSIERLEQQTIITENPNYMLNTAI